MAQFNAESIGRYLSDTRKVKRNSILDKLSGEPAFDKKWNAWKEAETALAEDPKNIKLKNAEIAARGVVEKYINGKMSDAELSSMSLQKNKGNVNKEIENCLPLVLDMAREVARRSNERVSYEDLVQYGNLGLVIAAQKYFNTEIPSESAKRLKAKGFSKFSTYAYYWIQKYMMEGRNEIGSVMGNSLKTREDAYKNAKYVRDNGYGDDDYNSFENEVNKSVKVSNEYKMATDDIKQLERYVKQVFKPLNKYERNILFLALGIDTPKGVIYSVSDIAKLKGVNKSTISRDLSKIYNKLRSQADNKLHGEDAVAMASLLLGSDLSDINLPELRMASTIDLDGGSTARPISRRAAIEL